MTKNDEDFAVICGSGNIYRDFGEPDADVRLAKDLLAAEIIKFLRVHKLNNQGAQKLTGVNHTEFSRIKKPDLKRFTVDRLMNILNKLAPQKEIKIQFKDSPKRTRATQELAV